MLGSKLQKLFICGLPLFFLCAEVHAADNDAARYESSTTTVASEKTSHSQDSGAKKESLTEVVATLEKNISRFVISSGFGLIRAYKSVSKGSLGASGLADIKVSYLNTDVRGKKLYTTLRYFPFSIGPSSSDNNVNQEYIGVVSTYAAGAEMNFSSSKHFDYLASLELAMFFADFKELIPVSESNPPIRNFGPLVVAGAEVRYKPTERFHIGPRLYLGTGNFSFISLLINGSYYF